eukprot:3173-Heterococcus_DN1.PRE.2
MKHELIAASVYARAYTHHSSLVMCHGVPLVSSPAANTRPLHVHAYDYACYISMCVIISTCCCETCTQLKAISQRLLILLPKDAVRGYQLRHWLLPLQRVEVHSDDALTLHVLPDELVQVKEEVCVLQLSSRVALLSLLSNVHSQHTDEPTANALSFALGAPARHGAVCQRSALPGAQYAVLGQPDEASQKG